MTHDSLRRIGKSIQVLGLVLVSVFYSAQSLAYIVFDDRSSRDTLTIKKDSPPVINYSFTLSTSKVFFDGYSVSFADDGLFFWDTVPNTLTISALDGLVNSNEITFSDSNGQRNFTLTKWSDFKRGIPESITFTIPFLRKALENKIDQGGTEISFFVTGHGFKVDIDDVIPDMSVAIPDSHKVTIEIKREDYAHISGLEDIILPQRNAESFCVSSTTGDADTGGKITLDVASTNGFKLLPQTSGDTTAGSYAIGYSITLEGNSDGLKEETLTQPGPSNIQWEAHHANFLDEGCGKADNMALWVTMDGSEADALPGKYTDEVTITVAPAS